MRVEQDSAGQSRNGTSPRTSASRKILPKAAYHHGDLRRALFELALDMIAHNGVESLTLRGLGTRLGVSQTALYRHFTNKDNLLEHIALEGFIEFDQRLEAARKGKSPIDALCAMLVAYVLFARTWTAHFEVMFNRQLRQKSHSGKLRQTARHSFSLLEIEVDRGIEKASLRPGLAATEVALSLWSLAHGHAALALHHNFKNHRVNLENAVESAARALLCGLNSRG